MNQFIQENIYVILLIFLCIILFLILLMTFFIFNLFLEKKSSKTEPPPLPKELLQENKLDNNRDLSKQFRLAKTEVVKEKFHCLNHPEIPSAASCLICEEVFCEKCLIEHEGLYFCREHFRTFTDHKWVQITDIKTTPDDPEAGQFVWDFKRHLWSEKKIATFVLTHYKINIESDFIESFVQLNVAEDTRDELEKELKNFRN